MSKGVARIDDRCWGICYHPSHLSPITIGGKIIGHAADCFADGGRAIARVGDEVLTDCGHEGTIATGSDGVLVESKAMARMGDSVTGYYIATITTSSDGISTT